MGMITSTVAGRLTAGRPAPRSQSIGVGIKTRRMSFNRLKVRGSRLKQEHCSRTSALRELGNVDQCCGRVPRTAERCRRAAAPVERATRHLSTVGPALPARPPRPHRPLQALLSRIPLDDAAPPALDVDFRGGFFPTGPPYDAPLPDLSSLCLS